MTARHFALKTPAAIFFIRRPLHNYGHCTTVILAFGVSWKNASTQEEVGGASCAVSSKKGQKFLNRHSRRSDQRSERSGRKLLVLWDREIRSHSRFCHHYVTSHLPHNLPAGFAEGVRRFLAGNVAEPPHPLSRQFPSNSDDHRGAIRPQRLHCLLILSP